MKLQLMSDIHLEFEWLEIENHVKGEVLVLAGDIAPVNTHWFQLNKFLNQCLFNFDRVIYVPGNHEYYEGDIQEVNHALKELGDKLPNLEVLIFGEDVTYEGVNFIGGTLWTDLSNPVEELAVTSGMNDFYIVYNGKSPYAKKIRFSGRDATFIYKKTSDEIFDKLTSNYNKQILDKTCVITHHAPSGKSVHPRYAGDRINAGYFTELNNDIAMVPPKYWFHGHMHDSTSYNIETCNVVCNPKGYYDQNPGFNKELVLEI